MSLPPLTVRGVLFDLDDTLNDRKASWMQFARWIAGPGELLGECDEEDVHAAMLEADEGGYRLKGELFADLQKKLPWRSTMTCEAIERIWREQFPACTVIRGDVIRVLSGLRSGGLRTGIVSNGRSDTQRSKINHMRIGHLIDAVIISEEVRVRKPDAAIYRLALEELGISPAETLFVGDHPMHDIVGPANIRIRTAWLGKGRVWPLLDVQPDYQINELPELIFLWT